ncbi:MAG: hypothetical protein ACREC1_00875 [Methylovirgula sp.]
MAVASLAEWRLLPEITAPVIQDETHNGSVYRVHTIGFLAVPPADCEGFDTSGVIFEAGKYLFPTAELEFATEKQLCRLPLQLSNWAVDSVALVHQIGRNPFPMQVEFGILRGRYYAEML